MVIYNSPKTQFLYIDIDNLCDPHRNCKNNSPDGYQKKEITAQHWFGHMAFLPFAQNWLENLKTLQVFTQIWGQ